MKTSKDLEVSKSNSLVRAGYRLTAVEQQMILFAIAHARETQSGLSPERPVAISAKDFADVFGLNPTNVYRQLQDAMEALFQRFITFHARDADTGKASRTKTRWISDCTYVEGEGQVKMTFAPLVIPHLMKLEPGFTRFVLKDMAALTGAHSIRLFELLIRFKSTGWAKITRADLRFAFGLAENEYPLTSNLVRRVINPAVDQINQKTSLAVRCAPVRKGKSIVAWEFNFFEKPKPAAPEPPETPQPVQPFDDAYISQNARPGESALEARARLYPKYKREVLLIEDDNQQEFSM